MCQNCQSALVGRREVLKLTAASLVTLGLGVQSARAASYGAATGLSPDEALAGLKIGNQRFTSNPDVCTLELAKWREEVAPHQAPWATIIACADSRVPP